MTPTAVRTLFVAVPTAFLLSVASAHAAQRPAQPPAQPRVAEQAAPIDLEDADAERVRERLYSLLEKYPSSLPRVLKLDPTLLQDQGYLSSYPALAAFLAQHPEIARNPAYFLQRTNVGDGYTGDAQDRVRQDYMELVGNFVAFCVFLVVTGVVIWLIRLFVEHRRWNRLSKVQFDIHNKLLDRFASNEELLAYIETSAGRRFLESAPIPLHDDGRPIGAPLARILWSLQAGVVLAIAGIGVLFISLRFVDEPAQLFFVMGIVLLALGIGFAVSAAAAYALSRKLGLLERPAPDEQHA